MMMTMKTIKIKESKLRLFASQILNEATYPTFGKGASFVDYKPYIEMLSQITNLHEDRYKDYELDEAWNNWKQTGCNKNSEEYLIYLSKFKNFMFGTGGFLGNISYVIDRLGGPLHSQILGPKWVTAMKDKKDWKYSNLNSAEGSEDWQCFYTTVLKIYQNPAIWNDFFFNPLFEAYKKKFDKVVEQIDAQINLDYNRYKTLYHPLLPPEFSKLKNFIKGIEVIDGKIEKRNNCHPELFYQGEVYDRSMEMGDDDDDEEY